MNIHKTLLPLLLLGLSFTAVSCDNQSALDKRMDEFRYTVDSLAETIAPRLALVGDKATSKTSTPGRGGEDIDAGRSSQPEDSRPDPNSMESVVAEVITKFDNIDPKRNKMDMLKELVAKLQASGKVSEKTIQNFESAVTSTLQAP
ncbi:hypothetical protein SH449x_001643 [Pirellulaceae bacterium SH449]